MSDTVPKMTDPCDNPKYDQKVAYDEKSEYL